MVRSSGIILATVVKLRFYRAFAIQIALHRFGTTEAEAAENLPKLLLAFSVFYEPKTSK